ncbi:isochorismatase hydrolase [Trichoderma arundinaceum]|uniref:Isochorismatase hydrolase n=1 Tax=Trichoderma arundinaceum TaxID=490622 RepID=A0A395NGH8_TRIAR|nr:isochorismatase hydrolase [Trichoderma arundinaceum]
MADSNSIFNLADETTPGSYGPSQTALLLIDFHTRFVDKAGGPRAPAALQVASEMRIWAKSQGIQVIQCLLDVNETPFPTFKGVQRYSGVIEIMSAAGGGAEVPAVLLEGAIDDVTFTRRPGHGSAFYSPGLEDFLNRKGIKSLILTGLPTSGSVARTAFAACDAEYVVTVISDGCVDPQESVHDMMVKSVLGARGWVTTSAAFQEGFLIVQK